MFNRISDPCTASDFFTAQILTSLQLLKAHVSDVRCSLAERWHSCQLLLSGSFLRKLMSTRGWCGDSGCVCVYFSAVAVTVTALVWADGVSTSCLFVCEIETLWHTKGGVTLRFHNACNLSVFVGCGGSDFAFCRPNLLTMIVKCEYCEKVNVHLWDPPNGPTTSSRITKRRAWPYELKHNTEYT